MRTFVQLTVLVSTAGILIATSRSPTPCASETVNLRADTTCGPTANLAVTSSSSCAINATGADFGGLPTLGFIDAQFPDAGVADGFQLTGLTVDGGSFRTCVATKASVGLTIECQPTCGSPDAGDCQKCTGTLTPQ